MTSPRSRPLVSNRELEQDVTEYLRCRRLYPRLSGLRFWVELGHLFSGAFLYVCEDFHRVDRAVNTLDATQQRQYAFLAAHPEHAEETRVFCQKVLAKYGDAQSQHRGRARPPGDHETAPSPRHRRPDHPKERER